VGPAFHLLAHSHGVAFLDAATDWRSRVTLGGPRDPRFGETFQGWFNGTLPARPFDVAVTRPGSALGAIDAWVMPTGGDLGDLVRLTPQNGGAYDVQVHPTFREVMAGWRGTTPVVSVIRGNDHALTMLARFPPYDFLDPDLPGVIAGVPLIDEAIIRRFVTPWAEMVVQPLVVVREVTGAPVAHVLPPPPRENAEGAPYREVLGDVIREFGFVPESLRLKWYRCYARVLAERLAAIGCETIFPPAESLNADGLLREDFAEGLTHGNRRYGERLAVAIEDWIAGRRP